MVISKISDIYRNDDIVYHYTSFETTKEYILKNKELRLSLRDNSIDPIENFRLFYSFSDNQSSSFERNKDAYKIVDELKHNFNNTKQISFCKNSKIKYEDGMSILPYEKYGFLKPQMWERYGDKYNGVCLAFSLSALKKAVVNMVLNNVEYTTYHELEFKNISINVPQLLDVGHDKYFEFKKKQIENHLFLKHEDYKSENEFRFCSFSKNEHDYIDISNALIGVFISYSNKESEYDYIKGLTTQFKDVDINFIDWSASGLVIENVIKRVDFEEYIGNELKKVKK